MYILEKINTNCALCFISSLLFFLFFGCSFSKCLCRDYGQRYLLPLSLFPSLSQAETEEHWEGSAGVWEQGQEAGGAEAGLGRLCSVPGCASFRHAARHVRSVWWGKRIFHSQPWCSSSTVFLRDHYYIICIVFLASCWLCCDFSQFSFSLTKLEAVSWQSATIKTLSRLETIWNTRCFYETCHSTLLFILRYICSIIPKQTR